MLHQPRYQRAQGLGGTREDLSCELVLPIDFHIRDDYVQHPLMNIDSGYVVWHSSPSGGSGEHVWTCVSQGHELSPLPSEGKAATLNYSRNTHAPDQTGRRSQLIH